VKIKPIEEHEQSPVKMAGAAGVWMRMLIGPQDHAPNFHMRHFSIEPGGNTPYHAHDYEHEVLILHGVGIVKSEQGDRPFKKDDVIFVPANERHQFINTGDLPCEFVCLIPAPQDCAS